MAKFVSRTHMAARCTDCSCRKPTPIVRSESVAAYSSSQKNFSSATSVSSSTRSTSRQQLAASVHDAAAPSYASWLKVPSSMLPPSSTSVTLWLYEPEHAADWISSARNSLSAKHASRPHSWVMIVPNELYSQMRPGSPTSARNKRDIHLASVAVAQAIAVLNFARDACGLRGGAERNALGKAKDSSEGVVRVAGARRAGTHGAAAVLLCSTAAFR